MSPIFNVTFFVLESGAANFPLYIINSNFNLFSITAVFIHSPRLSVDRHLGDAELHHERASPDGQHDNPETTDRDPFPYALFVVYGMGAALFSWGVVDSLLLLFP